MPSLSVATNAHLPQASAPQVVLVSPVVVALVRKGTVTTKAR
jgi:hypothetical protein